MPYEKILQVKVPELNETCILFHAPLHPDQLRGPPTLLSSWNQRLIPWGVRCPEH